MNHAPECRRTPTARDQERCAACRAEQAAINAGGSDRERRAEALYYANRPATAMLEWSELPPARKDEYRRQAQSDQTNAAAYVGTAMRGRMDDIADLVEIAAAGASTVDHADRLEALGIESQLDDDASREEADERLSELPLCVERTMTFEVVLGTGGPDDRLCFECEIGLACPADDDTITTPTYEIRRVLYRYSWSGSGEVELYGEDREAAEAFARRVVPELVE